MSLRRMIVLLLALLLLAAASASATERSSRVRESAARTVLRLLPRQPAPAHDFAPVPVERAGARAATALAIWVDGRISWIGDEGQLMDGVARAEHDLLDPIAVLPPNLPPPGAAREICVGTVIRADFEEGDEDAILELDCELVPNR